LKLNSEALGTTIKEKTDWKENHSPNDQCLLCESEPAIVPNKFKPYNIKTQFKWNEKDTIHCMGILYTVYCGLFAI